jgi:ABC-type polysaccharide/polyol phosphate transport system ATPase subunit
MSIPNPVIELRNVSMKYESTLAGARTLKGFVISSLKSRGARRQIASNQLEDINLIINHGERVGIIGKNGSGKSTLLKVIAGVIKPNSGYIRVAGSITPLMDIGTGMNGELTCLENTLLSGAFLGNKPSKMKKMAPEILEWCGLSGFEQHYFNTLSTGMQSRLAFAVATSGNPDIILIDEIMSVGDIEFQKKSASRLTSLQDSGSVTLIVSHDLDYLSTFTNRVVWIESGKIKMDGESPKVLDSYKNSFAR